MRIRLSIILLCLTCAFALSACTTQPATETETTADTEARLAALEKKNLDAQAKDAELRELREQNKQYETILDAKKMECKDLKFDLETCRGKLLKSVNDLGQYKERLGATKKENGKLKVKAYEQEKQIKYLEALIEQLKAQIKSAEGSKKEGK